LAKSGVSYNHRTDVSSLFCSEYVAESFLRAGLLPKSPVSNNYVPGDFNSPDVGGRLLRGAKFGPLVSIKLDSPQTEVVED
jgi:hypothetical protein